MPSQHRPSLSSVHIALTQLGYQMVAQNGEMRWYQLQEHTEVNLFLDLGELTTFEDLSRALAKNGENVLRFSPCTNRFRSPASCAIGGA